MSRPPDFYGAKTDEARAFHMNAYEIIQRIPYGKVTSYGHVAKLMEQPRNSRQVGFALRHLPTNTSLEFHYDNVPWWRVINAQGAVSQAIHRQHQIDRLRREIPVSDDGYVDLSEFGWFPNDIDID